MSLNKRKIFASDTSDEDESFVYRRSSLKVNLSYNENSIDSGNESLCRTRTENDERRGDEKTVKRLSRGKYKVKNHQLDSKNKNQIQSKTEVDKCYAINNIDKMSVQIEGVKLKHLTVDLEDISTKEQYLKTSCKYLKDAILCKTKQIFDKENELSIKTAMVLGDKDESVTLNVTDHHCLKKKAIENTDIDISSNQQESQCSNIITPMKSDGRKSITKTIDKSKLTQRRLFVDQDKQVEEQIKCRIIENVILKKNLSLFPQRQVNQSDSPILSGSNRRLSLFRAQSKHSNQFENLNDICSIEHSIQDKNIEIPIVCSTFIEDDRKKNDMSRITCTVNNVISMEMTKLQGDNYTSKELSLQNRDIDINEYNGDNNKKSKEDNREQNKQVSNMNQIKDIECSINATNNVHSQDKSSINYKTDDAIHNFETIINNAESIVSNDQDSLNTVRTSLHMNTSIDSIRKTSQKNDKDKKNQNYSSTDTKHSSIESKETINVDSLENISLIERLRNISMRNHSSRNNKSNFSKMRNEGNRCSNNSSDSYSYIEATPFPISRSVLFKSQLKHKTLLDNITKRKIHLDNKASCNNESTSMDNEEENGETNNNLLTLNSTVINNMPNETEKIKTNILKDTHSCNSFITQNLTKDVYDTTKSEIERKNIITQNVKCTSVKKSRRKLLPLKENSQCSIEPIEKRRCTPEESTSVKQNKRLNKKLPKRKSILFKNNKRNIKRDMEIKQTWSDSDSDISEIKKKQNKKARKPKKVISKKIFIKKYANENILNILKEDDSQNKNYLTENRDSLDDFTKCRTISTQWNKYKSQKIVIVTTGLSKGDKSLVKSIVKSLGAANMELNVSRQTTHVVSTGVRTVNLLRGIIRGCWLVTLEWVLKSLENNTWLDPETFEMKHFSKAVQENRKDKQLFGPSYVPELFTACGFIHVERNTTMPCDTLKELIKTAGGHITENVKLAKIIIGANGLKETWVIDSITTGELQLTKLYQRK